MTSGHETGHQPKLEPNLMKGHHIPCSLVPQSQSYLLDQKEEMALKLIRNLRGPLRFKSFPYPLFLIYKKPSCYIIVSLIARILFTFRILYGVSKRNNFFKYKRMVSLLNTLISGWGLMKNSVISVSKIYQGRK